MSITYDEKNRCFLLSNQRISYCIGLVAGKYPVHLYWGRRIRAVSNDVLARLTAYTDETFSLHEMPLDSLPQECPTFGCSDLREGMLHIVQGDGAHALDLRYDSYVIDEHPADSHPLPGLPSARRETAQTLTINLRDSYSGIAVQLSYTIYEDVDIIARSARIYNRSSQAVHLERALSACVDFEQAEGFSLLTLGGAWARERMPYVRPLVPGDQGVSTARGASSHQTSPFMALLSPGATEESGEVYGFALCYSGSFTASVQVDQHFMARAQIGINPFNFQWTLNGDGIFDTPEAYLCYSPEGLGGMSRQFHTFIHRHIVRKRYANVLINNWEATYFQFDEEKLLSLARCAKDVGIDLFVLDDGWFGHRDADNSSLGDWVDNLDKLPGGLSRLSERIHALGLKFGLWVEPEMVSPDSDLYRAHPDWCIHVPYRDRLESRHQLVLDLSRDEVRDYIVDAITTAMHRGNVDYIKWDMNRNISMWGSAALPADRQQELGHRYILGLYDVLDRVVKQFPDVLFESCAGGGGRFDLGLMCYMPQAWCSDDTDAWMRCLIQYGTSYVFPPSTMGAHVSAVPNHQTGRITPLLTRAAVAMGGTYGYELDLTKLPAEELDAIRKLNLRVKELRPLLLYGTFYRLRSPHSSNEAAWMSVSEDRSNAVVTHVYAQAQANAKPRLLRLRGLDPKMDYLDEDTGIVYGGDELMYRGIPLKTPWGDYMAQQFVLTAVDPEDFA